MKIKPLNNLQTEGKIVIVTVLDVEVLSNYVGM